MSRLQTRRGGERLSRQSLIRCVELLQLGYSPERASGRTQIEGLKSISHEALYTLIYGGKTRGGALWQKKRRKRYGSGRQRRGRIPNRIGIEHRCSRGERRSIVGYWESDTVIGRNQKQVLVTLVERKTDYGLVRKVKTKHAAGVAQAIVEALTPMRVLVKTITFDNGLEFTRHDMIAKATGAKISFLDPYASWQLGTNENWNGLTRQFFPKNYVSQLSRNVTFKPPSRH